MALVFPHSTDRDLFLSYNARDRTSVSEIREALAAAGISTFHDCEDLTPGALWFEELEEALGRVRGVAVFIGRDGLGRIQKREMYLALDRQASEAAAGKFFPVIPILL